MVAALFQPLNSRGARNNPGQRMKYKAEQQALESVLHPLINPEHTLPVPAGKPRTQLTGTSTSDEPYLPS